MSIAKKAPVTDAKEVGVGNPVGRKNVLSPTGVIVAE
jgi:hypothetical protein